jgi:hypothetical protein
MAYKFNRRTYTIESEDRSVSIECLAVLPERGIEFVLTIGTQRIGFRTSRRGAEDEESKFLPDGTWLWRFNDIFCRISRSDPSRRSLIELTNTYKFATSAEQRRVLEIFAEALAGYNGNSFDSEAGRARASVEYTQDAMNRVARGEFIL